MANYIGAVIGLTLAVIVTTAVLIPQIKAVNTTNWSASEVALIGTTSLIAIMGLLYGVASGFGLV
jgi:hypothetical protein